MWVGKVCFGRMLNRDLGIGDNSGSWSRRQQMEPQLNDPRVLPTVRERCSSACLVAGVLTVRDVLPETGLVFCVASCVPVSLQVYS